MANRDEITQFCGEFLDAPRFDPIEYGPNGLQVPGSTEVRKIVSCVSANLASIEKAVTAGADMVLAHHGIFWKFQPRSLSAQTVARVKALLDANASLLAFHLPLDAHPEVGNNALLCQALGLERGDAFGFKDGISFGWQGRSELPVAVEEMSRRIEDLLDRKPLLQGREAGKISEVGIVSGGGTSFLFEAIDLGLDAMLTGEPSEFAMAAASEADLCFFAAGHYATETLGVRALGELLARLFGVEHEFVDVPNPV